jgi:hypothetical protein
MPQWAGSCWYYLRGASTTGTCGSEASTTVESRSSASPCASKLLQGRGKTVRHVVLSSVADFDRAEIEVLIAAALKLAKLRLDAGAKSSVIIKAEAQKQRARRATR